MEALKFFGLIAGIVIYFVIGSKITRWSNRNLGTYGSFGMMIGWPILIPYVLLTGTGDGE
jgi:hypothetical protein